MSSLDCIAPLTPGDILPKACRGSRRDEEGWWRERWSQPRNIPETAAIYNFTTEIGKLIGIDCFRGFPWLSLLQIDWGGWTAPPWLWIQLRHLRSLICFQNSPRFEEKKSLLDLALQMFFTALSVLIRCSFPARPTQALEKYLISRAPTERPNANLRCRHRLLSFGLPGVSAYIVVNKVRIRILNSRARLKAQMPNLWN